MHIATCLGHWASSDYDDWEREYVVELCHLSKTHSFEYSESAILTVDYSLSILSLRQLRDILQTQMENKNSDQLKVCIANYNI